MDAPTRSLQTQASLRGDALRIWQSGVDAVDSARLVIRHVSAWQGGLNIAGRTWLPRSDSQICVVGAGKAGAGMAAGLEQALGAEWLRRTSGWVNVPDDCVRNDLKSIHLHGARPAGLNEPTAAGVEGTQEILRRVSALQERDLCIVLLSGGGSALLPGPVAGITLADKQQITQLLMRSGATIEELNCVRRALSTVKGGGLLRACRAGLLVALIISDVIGDPLETIASGPTVDLPPQPQEALAVLERLAKKAGFDIPEPIAQALMTARPRPAEHPVCDHVNRVIGNNRTAVEAAALAAVEMGYVVAQMEWDQPGIASDFGRHLAQRLWMLSHGDNPHPGRQCIVSGGETTVQLARIDGPQRGGRNQELVLAAAVWLLPHDARGIALVSGGTDGEDGPTDAAGAVLDSALLDEVRASGVDPRDYLKVNNSYPFFERFQTLIKTGPTHTNVMDLRVGLVSDEAGEP